MPAWYNNLPESVKRFESTRDAAIEAYEITASQDLSTSSSSFATATATATTSAAKSTATSSSNGAVSLSSTDSVLRTARAAGALGLGFILTL
ncbi:hypothetical protein N7507_003066 [Penicillium longicatenatum]|nr:hypothetical protein N7507_003066 [Penicillium longicatenatum]